jgi:predicted homoserine dehydrogenase-like protein
MHNDHPLRIETTFSTLVNQGRSNRTINMVAMVKDNTIGVAFLGLGRMGETHLRNLTTINGVKVVVVADPARERAERGRQMTGAELALTEPEKAIEHPSVDAVVIVTPTNTQPF